MGQVLVNNTGRRYARETSPGVLPGSPDWKVLELNTPGPFGAEIETVARTPISNLGQNRKGTTVRLTARSEHDTDLTIDSIIDFVEAFLYATATNVDLTFRAADGQTGPAGYTIPSATAAQAAKIQFTSGGPITLIHAAGYANAANNTDGTVSPIAADVGATDTVIEVTGVVAETAPSNAEVSVAGIRAEAGDLALAVSAGVGTLSSGNNAAVNNIDFTTLGLTVGQKIHVGGLTATNRFGSTAGGSNDSFGSARIVTIAAGALTLDNLDSTLTASDGTDDGSGGSNVATDLLFGRFVRNVAVDDSEYAILTHQFEAAYPNLYETEPPTPVANPDGFEYVTAAQANQMTITKPVANKATIGFTFVGRDAEEEVDNASRKSGASTARLPLFTGAFSTGKDFFRLRLDDSDETNLAADFKDLTTTITNDVAGEYVLGTLGPRYVNKGNFGLTIAGEALFNKVNLPNRIRNNTTVRMDFLLRNNDGAVAIDVASATVGNGLKNFTPNESVRIALTVNAFVDPTLLSTMGASFFPAYPSS